MIHPAESEPIAKALARLDHLLPGQAPILDFVHHNTLHGFQHLPFAAALAEAERFSGSPGLLPDADFRRLHAGGRILDEDLAAVLARQGDFLQEPPIQLGDRRVSCLTVAETALLHDLDAIPASRLAWLRQESDEFRRLPADLSPAAREALVKAGEDETWRVEDLWQACQEVLGLLEPGEQGRPPVCPGSDEQSRPAAGAEAPPAHREMRAEARRRLDAALAKIGPDWTLRGWVLRLTGQDSLDRVRPLLTRIAAGHLDLGLAAWHAPGRGEGLHAAWRRLFPAVDGRLAILPTAQPESAAGQESSHAAIARELRCLGLPETLWEDYLVSLALELPGWAGQFNWRAHRPRYSGNAGAPTALEDFLAIRLELDRQVLEPLCREHWSVPANLPALRVYFEKNLSEFLVRQALCAGELPELLASEATALAESGAERQDRDRWRQLADRVFAFEASPGALGHTAENQGWRLFRLAQYLGISGEVLRAGGRPGAERLLAALDRLPTDRRRLLWLHAYERRYREDLFNGLAVNRGRTRPAAPEAQVVFCMDDREEGVRRHLEALNPAIETLGAAGFFGVPLHWRGLDDRRTTPLCPVVVVPSHEVREVPRPGLRDLKERHDRRLSLWRRLARGFHQELRRNLLSSQPLVDILSPAVLLDLVGRVVLPVRQARAAAAIEAAIVPAVPTRVYVTAEIETPASSEKPRLGFTDTEQAERVGDFLRNIGLTAGFGRFVVLMGHGSDSRNNPHLAAYDCGACSGRHGGPNARAFAAMANRREIRQRLAERGIVIPAETWFLGAEHNTCDEAIAWYDLEDLPEPARPAFHRLAAELAEACRHSAHERCRRLASAPRQPGLAEALAHMAGRAKDFSQARPELGHATNAGAIVGRRELSRGLFLDRRVFLISYDPAEDPEGKVLEGILVAVGPVGAGINLEYYFSTVDSERYGCGTKVPHNVAGLFGVMEGAASDLRTGLPRQMTEIHEAMRLQLVVEHKTEVLAGIYERQAELRELIGNGWLNLAALDPDTGAIAEFIPGQGFVPWEREPRPLPEVASWAEWYTGHAGPLGPAVIREPDQTPAG